MAYRRPVYRRRRRRYATSTRRRSTVRRTRTTTRRRKTVTTMVPAASAPLTPTAKFALAQLDPFHPLCQGAKIPDSNTMPSIANVDTDLVSIAGPGTAGHLVGAVFRPSYTWSVVSPTAGTSWTWPANYGGTSNRTKRTSYVAAMELTRPVGHAIRISSPIAPTTATGFVHIAISTESTYGETTWTYPTTVAEMSNLSYYKRVTLASLTQSPLTIINKWVDDTAFRYLSPTSNLAASFSGWIQTDQGWGAIVVMIEGAAVSASTILSVEHILHSEGIPDKNGVIIGTTAAPNNPGGMSAISTATSETDFTHTEAEQDSYIQQGLDAIARGGAEAGNYVFQSVALPLLQRVGQGAVSAATNFAMQAIMGRGGLPGVNANPNRLALN